MDQQHNGYKACLRCGKLMPHGASFCNSCGADLSGPPLPGMQGAVNPAQFRSYGRYPPPYTQRRTDTLAITSLACAIASFLLVPLFPAIAAIVTGFMSRERIRESGGELEGAGMAAAGILVGVANLVLLMVLLLVIILSVMQQ